MNITCEYDLDNKVYIIDSSTKMPAKKFIRGVEAFVSHKKETVMYLLGNSNKTELGSCYRHRPENIFPDIESCQKYLIERIIDAGKE